MSTIRTTKISENLSWQSLKDNFFVGKGHIEGMKSLQEAINDGTILGMMQQCGNELHGGDIGPVVTAMKRNLSSKATNMRKSEYPHNMVADKLRWDMLYDFLYGLEAGKKSAAPGMPETTKGKSLWQLSIEEIEQIDKGDYKALDSVYQNMMSKKARKPEDIDDMKAYLDRLSRVSALRSAAGKLGKLKESMPAVSKGIVDKLSNGKKTLTAAEAKELYDLLSQLQSR